MSTNPAPQGQRIGVPREIFPGEKRVATVPETVEKLIKLGFRVAIETGAGDAAHLQRRCLPRRRGRGAARCSGPMGGLRHPVQGAPADPRKKSA
ncbi:hypothetical protein MASR1M59_01650 [Melaminivora sp.]